MSGRNHGLQALAAAFVVTVLSVVLFALHANGADTAFRASAAVTSVAREVTVDAVIIARQATTAEFAGVCFSDAGGRAVDFPLQHDVRLSTVAVPLQSKGTLAAGRYTFAACVRVGDTWSSLGAVGRIDVADDAVPRTVSTALTAAQERLAAIASPAAAAATSAAPASAGSQAPASAPATPATPVDTTLPVGDLPGWRQVLAEDFTTPLAEGRFPGRHYRDQWFAYDGFTNPSGTPLYDTRNVTSVHDGLLDVRVREEDGAARGAGIVAQLNGDGTWGGRVYGRYSVRLRFDAVPEWGAAVLLWSDRNEWHDGEIDFAEGGTDAAIGSYNHRLDDPTQNALAVQTTARWQDWHVATVEWTASGVTFLMDGEVTGHSTVSPSQPLHLAIQTIRTTAPLAGRTGHLQVDWVAAWEAA